MFLLLCHFRRSSCASSMLDLSAIEQLASSQQAFLQDFESQHLLISALLNFVDSPDYMIGVKAMDTLLVVCALPDQSAAVNAVQGTPLCSVITDRLTKLYQVKRFGRGKCVFLKHPEPRFLNVFFISVGRT